MGDTIETLYRIAGEKAAGGDPWDALTAHLAADTLTVAGRLQEHRTAMLDISPLRSLDVPGNSLAAAAAAVRAALADGLAASGAAEDILSGLPAITLPETELDPTGEHAFAASRLAGRTLDGFSAAEKARAARLAAFATTLHGTGEDAAAYRTARAADEAAVAAHYGAEAAAVGDHGLAAYRTAVLLAEDAVARAGNPGGAAGIMAARAAHDGTNLTGTPIHWEPLPFLA